jgi:hypothetical protein
MPKPIISIPDTRGSVQDIFSEKSRPVQLGGYRGKGKARAGMWYAVSNQRVGWSQMDQSPNGNASLPLAEGKSIWYKEKESRMKMHIMVTITDEDESALREPTTAVISLPKIEDYSSPEVFDQVFYQYEQTVLNARKEVFEEATEDYLSAVGEKKRKKSQQCKEERSRSDQKNISSMQR